MYMYSRIATVDAKEIMKYRNTKQYRGMKKNTGKTYQVIADNEGYRHYKRNGLTHRAEGPAIIYRSGVEKYFIDDVEYTEHQHKKYKELHHAYGYPDYYVIEGVYYTEEELAFAKAEQESLIE